jgi:hypothetical protein
MRGAGGALRLGRRGAMRDDAERASSSAGEKATPAHLPYLGGRSVFDKQQSQLNGGADDGGCISLTTVHAAGCTTRKTRAALSAALAAGAWLGQAKRTTLGSSGAMHNVKGHNGTMSVRLPELTGSSSSGEADGYARSPRSRGILSRVQSSTGNVSRLLQPPEPEQVGA